MSPRSAEFLAAAHRRLALARAALGDGLPGAELVARGTDDLAGPGLGPDARYVRIVNRTLTFRRIPPAPRATAVST